MKWILFLTLALLDGPLTATMMPPAVAEDVTPVKSGRNSGASGEADTSSPSEIGFESPELLTATVLRQAMQNIPAQPIGVHWDGETEQFIYRDSALLADVTTIAAGFFWHPQRTATILAQLPSTEAAKFKRNSHTTESWTRTEPFDLIQGEMTRWLYQHHGPALKPYGGNRVVITELVHRKLHLLMNLAETEDSRGADLPSFSVLRAINAKEVLVLCAQQPTFALQERIDLGVLKRTSLTPFVIAIPLQLNEITWLSPKLQLACDDGQYVLRTRDAKRLAPPATYNSRRFGPDQPLEVFVNFTIVDYVQTELLEKISQYMQLVGYQLQERNTVEALPAFATHFANSDVFIPVADTLNVNRLKVGKGASHQLVFVKETQRPTGERVPIRITALFPQGGDTVKLPKQQGIAHLLSERRQRKPYSMVIINASCHSDRNLSPWTDFYEQSLVLDQEQGRIRYFSDARDMPHVFASQRSFPTGRLSDMITNFSHPLNAIELLAQGGSPRDIHKALAQRAPETWQSDVVAFWEEITGRGSRKYVRKDFDPIYNLASRYSAQFYKPSDKILVEFSKNGVRETLNF